MRDRDRLASEEDKAEEQNKDYDEYGQAKASLPSELLRVGPALKAGLGAL